MNAWVAYWQARTWWRGASRDDEGAAIAMNLALGDRPPEPCIYPGCQNSRRARGLCHLHLVAMQTAMRTGKADEEDLMRRRLLQEKGTGGGEIVVGHDAFLRGSRKVGDDYDEDIE